MTSSLTLQATEPPRPDPTFSIVLQGIRSDVLPDDATAQLASLFKTSPEHIRQLLAQPGYTVKKGVPLSTASQYKRAIEAAGGICEIPPDNTPSMVVELTLPVPAPAPAPVFSTVTPQPTLDKPAVAARPSTSPVPGSVMQNIAELKETINTKTLHFVLLTLLTFEIYPLLWLTRHHDAFNRVTKKRTIDMSYLTWMAICVGLGGAFSGSRNENMALFAVFLFLAARILEIVWAFRAKAALQEYVLNEYKIELKMSSLRTFAFSIFYINYCINDLPEVLRKHQILSGQASA